MPEFFLLVNYLDGHNRRWLQTHLSSKPENVKILDWNADQNEWATKNMTIQIASFPTFVEKDNDFQFAVSHPLDWDDAFAQISWQKEMLSNNLNVLSNEHIEKKKANRTLLGLCFKILSPAIDPEEKKYLLNSVNLTELYTSDQLFQQMYNFGEHCGISKARILAYSFL